MSQPSPLIWLLVASAIFHGWLLTRWSVPVYSVTHENKSSTVAVALTAAKPVSEPVTSSSEITAPATADASTEAKKEFKIPTKPEQINESLEQVKPEHAAEKPKVNAVDKLIENRLIETAGESVQQSLIQNEDDEHSLTSKFSPSKKPVNEPLEKKVPEKTEAEVTSIDGISEVNAADENSLPAREELHPNTAELIEELADELTEEQFEQESEPSVNQRPLDASDYNSASYAGGRPTVLVPAIAKKKRMRGQVILRGLVNEYGELKQAEVFQSSGHDVLDKSALAQALTWKYTPAVLLGQPLAQWVQIPITF